jgi:hypothetical protein
MNLDQVAAKTLSLAGNDSTTQKVVAKMLLRDAGYEGDRLTQLVGRVLDLLSR